MTRQWVWLDRAGIFAIHDMQLAEHGGAGVRDAGLLELDFGKSLHLQRPRRKREQLSKEEFSGRLYPHQRLQFGGAQGCLAQR